MRNVNYITSLFIALQLHAVGCATATTSPSPQAAPRTDVDGQAATRAVHAVLDDWHAAAAVADEARYFAHLTEDAIFLGTDATERWDKAAFLAYARGPFSRGRGWRFESVRRDVVVRRDIAWFDETLATQTMGPARGSGVLLRNRDGRWQIAHYNLAITVPNDRFAAVRDLLARPSSAPTEPAGADSPR